ncbi:MAG: MBL fold metallo-hydrolase [Erysipelotrichaceae bacterium]|nr:MBL fold metallo-hydrolase [Erysipelotrichaceae bacterium]
MKIETYVMGPLATNTYLLSIEDEAILIDPAAKAEKVIEKLGDRKLIGILLTHGHFDHIKAVDGLYEHYHCPVYLHPYDEPLARDKYSGAMFGLTAYISCPIQHLKEGRMQIGPFGFEVIFTPGHTPGSAIFVFEDAIFTGDTLFKGSVGRTDLEGGDERLLKSSLRIFKEFDKDYLLYPGHDQASTLADELANNWFLR